MSRDIRTFFKSLSNKPSSSTTSSGLNSKSSSKSKVKTVILSSDDEVIEKTPEPSKQKKTKEKLFTKRKVVISSDSEEEPSKTSSELTKCEKLKPVNVDDIFGKSSIKQSKVEKVIPENEKLEKTELPTKKSRKSKSKKTKTELGVHEDDLFEKTLLDLDDDILLENVDFLDKTMEEALTKYDGKAIKEKKKALEETSTKNDIHFKKGKGKSFEESLTKHDSHAKKGKEKVLEKSLTKHGGTLKKDKGEALEEDYKKHDSKSNMEKEKASNEKAMDVSTPDKVNGKKRIAKTPKEDTPAKKIKLEHTDSGIDPGQEAHEKRRYSAMLYQSYLNRGGPKHQGEKELPKGKPDCLRNMVFLRTGVLDSLDGEEFEFLIKNHGGKVVHSVSKKVNYVVLGESPGPAKLQKAQDYKIPNINEDELLDMILEKSGMDKKYTVNFKQSSSEDLGIGSDIDQHISTDLETGNHKDESHDDSTKVKSKVDKEKKRENGNSDKGKDSKSQKFEKKHANERHKESHGDIKPKIDKEEKHGTEINKTHNKSSHETSTKEKSKKIERDSQSSSSKVRISDEDSNVLSLTDKYKPKDIKSVVGQQGDSSNLSKLMKWLSTWYGNRKKTNLIKPSPWAKNDDGAYFKCALLSGPPGVGKTTTAHLVATTLGYDVVEFNASDTRSKKLLHQEVSQLLSTTTIAGYASGKSQTDKKRVLLMDEVDGMAGNEDRGGIQELINLIKSTSVPIICMCNDRNHQKMRSLVNYCYDLKFTKPKLQQILGFVMGICCKEGIKLGPDVVKEIISGTDCDIRQTLNHLTMLSTTGKGLTVEMAQNEAKSSKKDTVLGPWEVCRTVFTESEHKNMSLIDRSRLFFYDYSLGPLFVQENYLKVRPTLAGNDKKIMLEKISLAADAISMGDLIDAKIRGSNNWSLLDTQAMFSSVLPGFYMSGQFAGQINFPGWLGKNSKRNKFKRIGSEIYTHTRIKTSGNKLAIKMDYVQPLMNAILLPLKRQGLDGVHKAVDVMKTYDLLRDDLDGIVELASWSKQKTLMSDIETRVKTAFTRTYNKEVQLLPFAPMTAVSKKKKASLEDDFLDDEIDVDSEPDDDINTDTMIKIKKKSSEKGKKEEQKKGKAVAGSSKGTTKKGRKK